MNYEDDVDLLANKKSAKKQFSLDNEISLNSGPNSPPAIPMRTRKTGVWSDEGSKSAKNKAPNMIEQERFQHDKTNEIDDIPIIPDIDDLAEDFLNLPDVKIPNVTVKESTYKELDVPFSTGKFSFGNIGNIDLSILTNRLYPDKEVKRCTEVWTMESLYQDLSKQ